MDGLIFAFSVVFPLCAFMVIGYGLRCAGMLDTPTTGKLNKLVFNVFLPMVIFLSIYNSDFSQDFSPALIVTAVGLAVIVFLACMLIIPRLVKENPKRATMIQGIYRSNVVLFGVPVAQTMAGDEAVKVMAMVIAFVVPLYNGLSVFALEWYSERSSNPLRIAKSMMKNPVIIGALCGFASHLLPWPLPDLVLGVAEDLSVIATPLALLALGGSLYLEQFKGAWKLVGGAVCSRLILCPLFCITVAILLGFRGDALIAIFCMAASPTAVTSPAMAQSMGADYTLAGQIVAMTSTGAILTIFLWVTFLENFNFL